MRNAHGDTPLHAARITSLSYSEQHNIFFRQRSTDKHESKCMFHNDQVELWMALWQQARCHAVRHAVWLAVHNSALDSY